MARSSQAVVERAQSMPKQGIAGAFNYGIGYGKILGVLAALDIPIVLLLLVGVEEALAPGQGQESLPPRGDRALARRTPTASSGCKHDGRAEACFIAAKWIADNHYEADKRQTPVPAMAD